MVIMPWFDDFLKDVRMIQNSEYYSIGSYTYQKVCICEGCRLFGFQSGPSWAGRIRMLCLCFQLTEAANHPIYFRWWSGPRKLLADGEIRRKKKGKTRKGRTCGGGEKIGTLAFARRFHSPCWFPVNNLIHQTTQHHMIIILTSHPGAAGAVGLRLLLPLLADCLPPLGHHHLLAERLGLHRHLFDDLFLPFVTISIWLSIGEFTKIVEIINRQSTSSVFTKPPSPMTPPTHHPPRCQNNLINPTTTHPGVVVSPAAELYLGSSSENFFPHARLGHRWGN